MQEADFLEHERSQVADLGQAPLKNKTKQNKPIKST